jgi:hypothetical protein
MEVIRVRMRPERIRMVVAVALAASLSGSCATNYDYATASIEKERYEAAVDYLKKGSSEGDVRCDYLLGRRGRSAKIDGRKPVSALELARLSSKASAGRRDSG